MAFRISLLICIAIAIKCTQAQDPTPQAEEEQPKPQAEEEQPKQQDEEEQPKPQEDESGPIKPQSDFLDDSMEDNVEELMKETPESFIEFGKVSDSADRFLMDSTEFIFVNMRIAYRSAQSACRFYYKGNLAMLQTREQLDFIAEALSETRFNFDTLWISARNPKFDDGKWFWERGDDKYEFDASKLASLMVTSRSVQGTRECMGFARSNHSVPMLVPLDCEARRAYICELPRGGPVGGYMTHPGWIKIGLREYKIVYEKVPYAIALTKCYNYDIMAHLAVIDSFEAAQQLGRFLLIGRPSLENAWIGARWKEDRYVFRKELLDLQNKTDPTTKYPPWRDGEMTKPYGCILLDRHLALITLFVEANCNRERPYICYRNLNDTKEEQNKFDIIFKERAYRVHLIQKPWKQASTFCTTKYKDFGAKLVEIQNPEMIKEMMYVMSENTSTLHHIWLGAEFKKDEWKWSSDASAVNLNMLDMLNKNKTYEESVEEYNNCLNMDRENHIYGMFYGTQCYYPQNFVCQFSPEQLRRLQKKEGDDYNKDDEFKSNKTSVLNKYHRDFHHRK